MQRSKPLCTLLQTPLTSKRRILPKSKLDRDIHQASCPWPQLELDLAAGRVEIDNNIVKNYRRISIHSREYLEDVLTRPATIRGAREAASLTPTKWLATSNSKVVRSLPPDHRCHCTANYDRYECSLATTYARNNRLRLQSGDIGLVDAHDFPGIPELCVLVFTDGRGQSSIDRIFSLYSSVLVSLMPMAGALVSSFVGNWRLTDDPEILFGVRTMRQHAVERLPFLRL